jgi:hypothetical protein
MSENAPKISGNEKKFRLLFLADAIEKGVKDHEFDMLAWLYQVTSEGDYYSGPRNIPNCRTVGCLAGTACVVFLDPNNRPPSSTMVPRVAADLLGLTLDEADDLFMPRFVRGFCEEMVLLDNSDIKKEAIRVLRHLANTGEIQWDLEKVWRRKSEKSSDSCS